MMRENPSTESDLRSQFRTLRDQETACAPSFDRITTMARCQSDADIRSLHLPVLVPLSAAALLCLLATFFLKNRESERKSLSSSLPVLLESDPERTSLFAVMADAGEVRRYLSDHLLPLHLRINL